MTATTKAFLENYKPQLKAGAIKKIDGEIVRIGSVALRFDWPNESIMFGIYQKKSGFIGLNRVCLNNPDSIAEFETRLFDGLDKSWLKN